MANSANPDQFASSEANWSGSTLFAKVGYIRFSRTRVNIRPRDIVLYIIKTLFLKFKIFFGFVYLFLFIINREYKCNMFKYRLLCNQR